MKFLKRINRPFQALAILCLIMAGPALAQQQTTPQLTGVKNSTTEVSSLCNPNKVESSTLSGKTTYSCEGKRPTTKPDSASKYKAVRGARTDINCSYSENGDVVKWLGCTCTADEDSKCTGFIIWCAVQGDEVSGSSGSASCSPGG
jgi:hypothetical protein